MVNRNGLIDLGFRGYAYTWNNRRIGKVNIQERLNRGFANGDWKLLYPNAHITHLTALHSDHRPIVINTSSPTAHRPRPLRFEAMWTRDDTAGRVIKDAWCKGHPLPTFPHLMSKIKHTKLALKEWNWNFFGHLQTNIKNIQQYIETLQSHPSSSTSLQLEVGAQLELDELLLRERILWMEKANAKWLEEGNANNHFFHLSTIIHRKHNLIHSLMDSENNRLVEYDQIAQGFIAYYSLLFTSVSPCFPFDFQELISPSVSCAMNQSLLAVPTIAEVHKAIFSMETTRVRDLTG